MRGWFSPPQYLRHVVLLPEYLLFYVWRCIMPVEPVITPLSRDTTQEIQIHIRD